MKALFVHLLVLSFCFACDDSGRNKTDPNQPSSPSSGQDEPTGRTSNEVKEGSTGDVSDFDGALLRLRSAATAREVEVAYDDLASAINNSASLNSSQNETVVVVLNSAAEKIDARQSGSEGNVSDIASHLAFVAGMVAQDPGADHSALFVSANAKPTLPNLNPQGYRCGGNMFFPLGPCSDYEAVKNCLEKRLKRKCGPNGTVKPVHCGSADADQKKCEGYPNTVACGCDISYVPDDFALTDISHCNRRPVGYHVCYKQ